VSGSLLLVRHAVTDWNREGRFQGHLNPPLSDAGREQAHLLAERLAADATLRPARVVTSSLARARQTAELVAAACGAALSADERLMEIGQGEWEGRTHTELEAADAERYSAWLRLAGTRRPPGAEPLGVVRRRLRGAMATLLDDERWPACIVSHGGALRLLAGWLLGLDAARAWALDLDNTGLSACAPLDGGRRRWRVERWNDTAHLLGRAPTHIDEAEGRPLAL